MYRIGSASAKRRAVSLSSVFRVVKCLRVKRINRRSLVASLRPQAKHCCSSDQNAVRLAPESTRAPNVTVLPLIRHLSVSESAPPGLRVAKRLHSWSGASQVFGQSGWFLRTSQERCRLTSISSDASNLIARSRQEQHDPSMKSQLAWCSNELNPLLPTIKQRQTNK